MLPPTKNNTGFIVEMYKLHKLYPKLVSEESLANTGSYSGILCAGKEEEESKHFFNFIQSLHACVKSFKNMLILNNIDIIYYV